jgi:hypothetical protein
MTAEFPNPQTIVNVSVDIPDGPYPPCMKYGLRQVAKNPDYPQLARGTFVAEFGSPNVPEDVKESTTIECVVLHCASAALGACEASLRTYRVPLVHDGTVAVAPEQVEALHCPQQAELDRYL